MQGRVIDVLPDMDCKLLLKHSAMRLSNKGQQEAGGRATSSSSFVEVANDFFAIG